jgi:hypothetical protein
MSVNMTDSSGRFPAIFEKLSVAILVRGFSIRAPTMIKDHGRSPHRIRSEEKIG